jgi:FMN phosphatase YigB (HAD superfamily)
MKLSDFDALTFDVYGTLIDWEPGILAIDAMPRVDFRFATMAEIVEAHRAEAA